MSAEIISLADRRKRRRQPSPLEQCLALAGLGCWLATFTVSGWFIYGAALSTAALSALQDNRT